VTRTPLSRSKGQGHQAALLSAALTRNKAADRSAWERIWRGKYCYVRCVCSAASEAPTGGRRGAGAYYYCVATRQLVIDEINIQVPTRWTQLTHYVGFSFTWLPPSMCSLALVY